MAQGTRTFLIRKSTDHKNCIYKKIIAKYIRVYTTNYCSKISAVALKQSLLLAQECCWVSVAMVTKSALTDEGNGVK